MRKFQVENVKCENCANLIKNSLKEDFGEIAVDMNAQPRTISLNIDESRVGELKEALKELNFSVIKEL